MIRIFYLEYKFKILKMKKKSNKPNVRINRAVKELTQEGNAYNIGTVIFEEIIRKGVEQIQEELKNLDDNKNYFIHPNMFKRTIEILESNLMLK